MTVWILKRYTNGGEPEYFVYDSQHEAHVMGDGWMNEKPDDRNYEIFSAEYESV